MRKALHHTQVDIAKKVKVGQDTVSRYEQRIDTMLSCWSAMPVGLPRGRSSEADNSEVWTAVDDIPEEELWEVRCRLRQQLVRYVRERSVWDRLGRGEPAAYAESAAQLWNDGTSGMKSIFNGGLQLSVLDGWWAEAYDGDNGWAIETPKNAN